ALLVGGVNNSTGDFVIKLNGQPAGAPLSLPPGTPSVADFTANPQAQVISIAADPSAVTLLELAADPATFAFTARLFGPDGALLASLTGLPGATLSLPPGTGNAILVLGPSSSESLGAVRLASGGASTSSSLPPAATQVISGPAPTNFCNLSSGGSVNLRSGPGTNFGIVGQLTPGTFLPVVGLSPDRGWYAATYNNQQVWASNSVTVLNGPCSNLPTIQPPAGPAQATTVPQPTAGVAVTETVTPMADLVAPTQAFASPTAPPQVAPPDNDYQVQLDRNNGGSFSQAISYPDGDTSDRIIVSVANFDSVNNFAQFNVTLVCNGTGAEFVRWGENLNTNTQCGGNLTLTLNNESNQRFLNVTLPSGSGPALVNYTLVFVKVG
ncbi:MAG TPA: SH3 domain-containing protein, partial [Candidatus Limnocylindrales bacterium]|nr:SH3 domain-containing protein [Candidatus Limnocylindrales bacterium]